MPLDPAGAEFTEATPQTVEEWDELRRVYWETWGKEMPVTPAEQQVREAEQEEK